MYLCMSVAPSAQCKPTANGFAWLTLSQNAPFVCLLDVRPAYQQVQEIISYQVLIIILIAIIIDSILYIIINISS